ncbi:MAG: hypothetical protein SWE60_18995 [Thermodesulfobacteriota bacterium]|nr:hypothetical protein [Thermodesulfobacteriota bacterium]
MQSSCLKNTGQGRTPMGFSWMGRLSIISCGTDHHVPQEGDFMGTILLTPSRHIR